MKEVILTIQLENVTYQTFKNNHLICLPPKTKVLAIKTYKGAFYATNKANDIFELRLLNQLVFEVIIETPVQKV